MAVFYGKISTSSDTQNKVSSGHPKHMPSKGAFALLCMAAVAAIAIGAVLYKRHKDAAAGSQPSAASRIANPVEKGNEMSSKHSNKKEKEREKETEYEGAAGAGAVSAAVAAKEKPSHKANARKSMKVDKLPKGWTEYVDDETGQFYYFEESSGQVQWTKPTK